MLMDFPFFRNNKLLYFDNAATTQKPGVVIDAMSSFYARHNAPVHRGVYALAEEATILYEDARSAIAQFIGAYPDEVIFTKGTTEAINFVASSWAQVHLKAGDEIIITELEHHANIVPWIRLEKTRGIVLKYIPIKEDGTLDYAVYLEMLSEKTKLVSCTHTSNVLGSHTDLDLIIEHAHSVGAYVLVDAAQAMAHSSVSVQELNADFLAFSAHKMFGPTGIGVLYVPRHMQSQVEPYQVGGGMVYSVDFHEASWAKPPQRYEAGTPPIAEAIGFKAAVDYINTHISFDDLKAHEARLTGRLINALQHLPVRILGPLDELKHSGHMVSFASENLHSHDIAAYLDKHRIAVRAGNHCAKPLHRRLGITDSVRISFAAYNTEDEVEQIIEVLFQFCNSKYV